jgi:hypothetical protein
MANSVAHRPVRPTIFLGPAKATSMDITHEESAAFWSWATVEVLRHTGIRIEEMLELTHHSFVAYTLPTTGEVVPMLQVAPSKTDAEPLVRTKMPVSDAHYFGLTQLKCPDWRRSAPTSSPDCRRPRTRAGSAKSPRSKPQWPQQRSNAATQKLEAMQALATQHTTAHLGCPVSVPRLAGRIPTTDS